MDAAPQVAAMTEQAGRFALEWLMPLEVGLLTHVALHDREGATDDAEPMGQSPDEAEALLHLWMTPIEGKARRLSRSSRPRTPSERARHPSGSQPRRFRLGEWDLSRPADVG